MVIDSVCKKTITTKLDYISQLVSPKRTNHDCSSQLICEIFPDLLRKIRLDITYESSAGKSFFGFLEVATKYTAFPTFLKLGPGAC